MNSSARLRSPLNMSGVFPTNLSFLIPPTAGAGGIGAGGPPPRGPNGPAGGPPPGGPPPHGGPPPPGGPPPLYIYLLGLGIPPPCGLIHPNGM
jgi:hypothetical protein